MKHRFREGDWVTVQVPRFVIRVGYPKSVNDYHVTGAAGMFEIEAILTRLAGRYLNFEMGTPYKVRKRIQSELAYMLAKLDGFGGRERRLHFVEYPSLAGRVCQVSSLRTVVTGTYVPASSGMSPEGEWDGEPACLTRQKFHRLATVTLSAPKEPRTYTSNYLELPVENLKIERSDPWT